MDRKQFFAAIRGRLFDGRLIRSQVSGIEAMLDEWEASRPDGDLRHFAYILATAYHETGRAMQPVRETLAASDDEAIRILDLAWRKGRLSQVREPYWRRDADGKCWLGRGLVQLTHKANYMRISGPAGVDLVAAPERAMEVAVAVRIAFEGMTLGLFTGHCLSDFFNGLRQDWQGARRIINGTDRASLIAGYGRSFYAALEAATGPAADQSPNPSPTPPHKGEGLSGTLRRASLEAGRAPRIVSPLVGGEERSAKRSNRSSGSIAATNAGRPEG